MDFEAVKCVSFNITPRDLLLPRNELTDPTDSLDWNYWGSFIIDTVNTYMMGLYNHFYAETSHLYSFLILSRNFETLAVIS